MTSNLASTQFKILCVDDEPSILSALTRVLGQDFTVLTAASAEQAHEVLIANPDTAVILSDQRMSGSSGLDFLKSATTQTPLATRALISGHVDMNEVAGAINSSRIHRLILKPWDNDYLRVQMLESLAEHRLRKEKSELEKMAVTDPATSLKNHRYFQDQLQVEVARAIRHMRPLSLFMIDMDHFKLFNDHHGHLAGDTLLKAIADRIVEQVRNVDIVARYGGDEFAVILPDTDLENAKMVGERMRLAFESKPFIPTEGHPTFVTISIGITSLTGPMTTAMDLVRNADSALYRAKRQGRNQSVGD